MIKYFFIRNFRATFSSVEILKGTCYSVGMLKGYMVRERLGTPVLYGVEKMLIILSSSFIPPGHTRKGRRRYIGSRP